MKPFLETLVQEGILADGAMGTEIYTRGVFINRCYDELNLSNPKLIKEIHESYINAGSGLIESNTFMSSRPALSAFGLESKVDAINKAGVAIAKEAANGRAYVAGSAGPIAWTKKDSGGMTKEEQKKHFMEHIKSLSDGGADLILLETFTNLEELHTAFLAAKEVTDLPVVTQVSLKYLGEDEFEGLLPEDAAIAMDSWGADVFGVNCCDGPQGVFEAIKRMTAVTKKPLSAMPNAGLPKMVNGRMFYLASPEYMAEYARRYALLGVSLIGGCCGTTPDHIRAMKKFLKAIKPSSRNEVHVEEKKEHIVIVEKKSPAERSKFGATLNTKFSVSVEIDPPIGVNPTKCLDAAKELMQLGVDAVNIADGPRAMARMSPIALGTLIKNKVGMETIVHYCCRDRNLLGMQMDLIGASALGLNNVLLITGDPPKMGHYPDATAVFDIDAIGLIRFVSNLNRGVDFAERPIKESTNFLIGCGVNPGAVDLDLEVERFRLKILSGAEFAFSQPIYDGKLLENFISKCKSFLTIPLFAGILPLVSLRNAEFMHNEVPGMQIPANIMKAMASAETHEKQLETGLSIAKDALAAAKQLNGIKGAYIFPPFGRYGLVKDLMKVIR